jgi:hypothetical protein
VEESEEVELKEKDVIAAATRSTVAGDSICRHLRLLEAWLSLL